MKMRNEVFSVLAERLTDEQLKREVRIFVRETSDVYIDDKGVWPSFDQFLAFRIGINAIRYVPQGGGREEMERFALACLEEARECEGNNYQIWPNKTLYVVAKPGGTPIFQDGEYCWPKEQAQAIAQKFNS